MSGLCWSAVARGIQEGPRGIGAASLAASRAASSLPARELRSLPVVSLSDLLGPHQRTVRIRVQAYEDGMLPSDQSLVLCSVLAAESPRIVLEIGTYMGHTTVAMAMNLPEATIHTVDLPLNFSLRTDPPDTLVKDDPHLIVKREVGREFHRHPCEPRIRQHFADTASWDFRAASGATFFFIDGSHTYDYCRNDSEKCLALCQGKGVFLWHDCDESHPGVVKLLREWRSMGRDIVRVDGTSLAYWKSC